MKRVLAIGLAGLLAGLLTLALVVTPAGSQGACSVYRSWSTGNSVTAADLNASFTRVTVTNMIPTCMDDYSASVTEMRSVADPYPSGAASQPTTLAGELERIRYVLKKMTGWSQWYAHTEGAASGLHAGLTLHAATISHVAFFPAMTASRTVFTNADRHLVTTGTVLASQGGTGFASYTVGDLLAATTSTTFAQINAVAVGQVLASAGTGTLPAWTGSPRLASLGIGAAASHAGSISLAASGHIVLTGVTHSGLGMVHKGQLIWCSDCQPNATNVCTAGGQGAWASAAGAATLWHCRSY